MARNRSLLVIGIPVAVFLLALVMYQYGYARITAGLEAVREEQAVKEQALRKYIAFIGKKEAFEKRIAVLKQQRSSYSAKLIQGATPSLAAAALQDTIKRTVAARGGTIASERVLATEQKDGFSLITVSVEAVLPDAAVLSNILYDMETQEPYLLVRELDVRVRNFTNPTDMQVRFDVSSLTGGQ